MRCSTLAELPPPPPGKAGWPWTEEGLHTPGTMPDGSSWPRVSIVTPSYNQGRFVEETIRSVLLQGYPNLEYIIIDGGSTDGSLEIIGKYEPWLAYWVSDRDGGQSNAINKGWRRATGEVLAWINSDDVYAVGTLFEVVSFLNTCPDAAMVDGQGKLVDEDGTDLGIIKGQPWDLANTLRNCINPVVQPSSFVRRRVLEKVGFLDQTLHMSMDWDLWLRLSTEGNLCFTSKVWSILRIHARAKTVSSADGFGPDVLRILQRFYQRHDLATQVFRVRRGPNWDQCLLGILQPAEASPGFGIPDPSRGVPKWPGREEGSRTRSRTAIGRRET